MKNTLIWFRNDLRISDHAPLYFAAQKKYRTAGVFVFNPNHFRAGVLGFSKIGTPRARFIIESVSELRQSLAKLGIQLYVRVGNPVEVICQLVKQLEVEEVLTHLEYTPEECIEDATLENHLMHMRTGLQRFEGHTLYTKSSLPFPIKHIPDLFTDFRKEIETESEVNSELPAPDTLMPLQSVTSEGEIPSYSSLFNAYTNSPETSITYVGGESNGKSRLDSYIRVNGPIYTYKQTRNNMLEKDASSKLSPWLAVGCISPRTVYHKVRSVEKQFGANDSTYWLIFELLWRDYFKFIALKYGSRIFQAGGIKQYPLEWKKNRDMFELWRTGKTGFPIVDANMRELLYTGFMSNRGRQNTASFLVKNLGIYWLWGAAWFESQLVDYDPCSNYGNWNYIAGIGNDARGYRYFNIIKQAYEYDPEGKHVKIWLPELKHYNSDYIHEPFRSPNGVNGYLKPIVNLEESVKENRKMYESVVKGR